jgi:hypothetical protein
MTQVIDEKSQLKAKLDQILIGKNIQKYLGTDPIRFPRRYAYDRRLQEVIALIAALLAYGRVKAIGMAIEDVLSRFGADKMIEILTTESVFQCEQRCQGFVYRFTTAQDLLKLMVGIRH